MWNQEIYLDGKAFIVPTQSGDSVQWNKIISLNFNGVCMKIKQLPDVTFPTGAFPAFLSHQCYQDLIEVIFCNFQWLIFYLLFS